MKMSFCHHVYPRSRATAAFTLVEVVIAAVIIGLGFVATAQLYGAQVRMHSTILRKAIASQYANSVRDNMLASTPAAINLFVDGANNLLADGHTGSFASPVSSWVWDLSSNTYKPVFIPSPRGYSETLTIQSASTSNLSLPLQSGDTGTIMFKRVVVDVLYQGSSIHTIAFLVPAS